MSAVPDENPRGLGERIGALLYGRWSEFVLLRSDVLKKEDPEAIHDLRVASRRIRTGLQLCRPALPATVLTGILRPIRRITRKLGRLRNLDEARTFFGCSGLNLPILCARLDQMRCDEMRSVSALLHRFPLHEVEALQRRAVACLGEYGTGGGESSLAGHLSRISTRRYRAMIDLLPPAQVPGQVQERHAFRIAVKKWRYLLEFLAQLSGRDYHAALEQLKAYQSVLGDLNDLDEFRQVCADLPLPQQEQSLVSALLAETGARQLARFLELAQTGRPRYLFML